MTDPAPARSVRREVVRVRREVSVELEPRRALRLGLRLVARALVAMRRGRQVRLTLRSRASARLDQPGQALPAPTAPVPLEDRRPPRELA